MMKTGWILGYDQQIRHLIVRTEKAVHYTRTYFACGKKTDYSLEYVYETTPSLKCPACLAFEQSHTK